MEKNFYQLFMDIEILMVKLNKKLLNLHGMKHKSNSNIQYVSNNTMRSKSSNNSNMSLEKKGSNNNQQNSFSEKDLEVIILN